MKHLLIISAALIAITSVAQTDSTTPAKKFKQFMVTVTTVEGKTVKGVLQEIDADQLIIRSIGTKDKNLSGSPVHSFSAEQLKKMTMERKGSKLRSALIGAGIGLVSGVVIGFVSGDDPVYDYPDPYTDPFFLGTFAAAISNSFAMTAGEKALAFGAAGTVMGALTGLIINSFVKKRFTIGGKKDKFEEMKLSVMDRMYGVNANQ